MTDDFTETTLFNGVPAVTETTLFTCPAGYKAVINAIHCSGDATGGTITVHLRPGGVAAATSNETAHALAVGAAAEVEVLGVQEMDGLAMKGGDVLSALQSAGTHITVLVEGDVDRRLDEVTLFNTVLGAAEGVLYTCPPGARATIDSIRVTNTTVGAVTVTAHLRPGGAAPTAANALAQALSIAAGASIDLLTAAELDGLGMKAGDILSALAGAGASLTAQVEGKVFGNA
jgi:hypothetical protein